MTSRTETDIGTWPLEKYLNTNSFHWLHSERSLNPSIAQWMYNEWYVIGENIRLTPQQLYKRGWEYLGVVLHRPKSKYLDN